jgi:hypothetical protein
MIALVVPTVRPDRMVRFLNAWSRCRFWDRLYIVMTGLDPDPAVPKLAGGECYGEMKLYNDSDIDEYLKDDSWIISRKDSAVRSFGFLRAYQDGATMIVSLDDDCDPIEGIKLIAGHESAFSWTPYWVSSVARMRVRGLPYTSLTTAPSLPNVMLNMGLWAGHPDLDAVTTLAHGSQFPYQPPAGSWVVPAGQFFPLCGMNFAFRREITPLMYFGLQGPPWPVARFDDIWCGIISKHIMDHLNMRVTIGDPLVQHIRASDPLVNLEKEARGIRLNEEFWRYVADCPLTRDTPRDCMRQVGQYFEKFKDDYFNELGRAMIAWAGLFDV